MAFCPLNSNLQTVAGGKHFADVETNGKQSSDGKSEVGLAAILRDSEDPRCNDLMDHMWTLSAGL